MWPTSCQHYQHQGRFHAVHRQGLGQPLLLVHGSLSSHGVWRRMLAELDARVAVLAPDLPGYGHSDPLPCGHDALAADAALIEALLLEQRAPCDLVAHSYGGAGALLATLAQPQRVRSLTLVEPVLFGYLRSVGDWANFGEVMALAEAVRRDHESGRDHVALNRFLAFWMPWWQRVAIPRSMRRTLLRGVPRLVRDFQAMHQRYPEIKTLARLPMPVTLVEGTRGPRPLRAVMGLLAAECPHWRRTRIPGAGHFSPVSHPAALARVVEGTLASGAQQLAATPRAPRSMAGEALHTTS